MLTVIAIAGAIAMLLHSCKNELDFGDQHEGLPSEIAEAARWYDGEIGQTSFIGSENLKWGDAKVSKDVKGQSLVTLPIYVGTNKNGQDSTRQLLILKNKQGVFKGAVRHLSVQNEYIADATTYSLNGRKLEEGVWFVKSDQYSILKIYSGEKRFVLMGWEEVPYDPFLHPTSILGPATPFEDENGFANPDAYNCHFYAWGPALAIPQDPGYVPGYPKWNNNPSPERLGYHNVPASDPIKVGDRVIYYQDTGIGDGYPIHSGIVTGVDENGRATEVTSKWGDGPLKKHHPANTDGNYGDNRKYYSKAE